MGSEMCIRDRYRPISYTSGGLYMTSFKFVTPTLKSSMSLLRRLEVCQANWKMLSYCIHRQRPRCDYSRSENCVMLFRRTPSASSPSSVRHRRLFAFPGGVARAHKTRLRQLCPGQASIIFTAAPPVCSQRCGSSGVSTKSCLGRPCNSTLAASTTTSRLQGGRHDICLLYTSDAADE